MFASDSVTERPVLWSHVMEAARYWRTKPYHPIDGTETSCVVSVYRLDVRAIRDWLDSEFDNFELWGIFIGDGPPVAIRFKFDSFDDKLLFALRWR